MTTKGYTFTPEGYTAQSLGKKYNFTPEDAVGKGHNVEEEESFWKSAARTALQIPQGIAEATGPGIAAGLFQLGALGESDLDIDTWHKLRQLAEENGETFDEESYEQARQEMLGMIPTVSNIASKIEKETGAPFEPKEDYQKALRLGSTAAKFQPGTIGQKLTAGVAAPAVSHGLQAAGLPEVFSEPLGLLAGIPAGSKGPKFDIGQAKKPSGLTERRFEGISKPTEVPQKKIQQINDKIEKDFRDISEKIIKDSPIGETAKNLAENPAFKQESRELLNQAQEIADAIPGTHASKAIKKEYADIAVKNTKGFALDEFDKNYLKFMKEANKNILGKEVTNGQLVEMYRKNNGGLGEYFEPGASKALNRAKKQALLDQNRAIANLIEKTNPELSKVFKEGNQRWSKIMDVEAVDEFISDIFPTSKNGELPKINYKKAQDLFDKSGYDHIFKRALGEDGYKAFERLTKDMLTSESGYKMLRVAQKKGLEDFVKSASSYFIHPNLAKFKVGLDIAKRGYRSAVNAILDEPKIAFTWKKAVDDLKKGDFKSSQKGFENLDKEVKTVKPEVLPKEEKAVEPKNNETIEAKVEKIEEPKQLEAPKNQIEYKEPEKTENNSLKEGREFRDRFMEKPTGNEIRDLEAKKSTKTKQKINEKSGLPKLSEDEVIAELDKKYPQTKKTEKPRKPEKKSKPAESLPETKIKEIKRQDISKKGLKEQKHWLIEKLDEAIEKAPEGPEDFKDKNSGINVIKKRSEAYELLTFDVPGDGVMRIRNHKKALEQFRNSVEKKWPDKPLKLTKKDLS